MECRNRAYEKIKYTERISHMKVLGINGSPRKDGNTTLALNEMKKIFDQEEIEFESKSCLLCFSECNPDCLS